MIILKKVTVTQNIDIHIHHITMDNVEINLHTHKLLYHIGLKFENKINTPSIHTA